MKKDQYFNLEVNFLNEDNVAVMMTELGTAPGLGIYMMLLLHLRTKDNYEASCDASPLKAFARRNEVDLDMLQRVLRDYGLFEVDEERRTFRSLYLDRVMKRLEERWRMNAENGKKGGRPRKVAKNAETPATKGGKPNETQEKRGEENKSITPVVNNSSNTTPTAAVAVAAVAHSEGEVSADAVAVATAPPAAVTAPSAGSAAPPAASMKIVSPDEARSRPLRAVFPWETLVDELAASKSYMELAGMHSGLGRLFIECQKQIITLFKNHIRLYGKGGELLFVEDVRRYFSNYIAAGSTTCRTLRETLLAQLREQGGKEQNCFESIVDGRRTFMGHIIPPDAPPRPDASAVWDAVRRRWVH